MQTEQIITIVLAIATCVQGFFAFMLWSVSNQQKKIMKEQMEINDFMSDFVYAQFYREEISKNEKLRDELLEGKDIKDISYRLRKKVLELEFSIAHNREILGMIGMKEARHLNYIRERLFIGFDKQNRKIAEEMLENLRNLAYEDYSLQVKKSREKIEEWRKEQMKGDQS